MADGCGGVLVGLDQTSPDPPVSPWLGAVGERCGLGSGKANPTPTHHVLLLPALLLRTLADLWDHVRTWQK
jgi:hypothetical protein